MLGRINILDVNKVAGNFAILASFVPSSCDIRIEKEYLGTFKKFLYELGFVRQKKAVAIDAENYSSIEKLLEDLKLLYNINIYPSEIIFKSIDGRKVRICEETIADSFKHARRSVIAKDIKKALSKSKEQRGGFTGVFSFKKLSAIRHFFF